MVKTSYAIALGSNRRHHRHGSPRQIVAAAAAALAGNRGVELVAMAPTRTTAAVGPAGRSFANSALVIRSKKDPDAILALLKKLERDFGRRSARRWGARVLDLDIILWSAGMWTGRGLAIPHPGFRTRRFVLDPLVRIAADWLDPRDNLTVRQLRARLHQPKPVDRARPAA
jgi:2-amino-4-hydroxy-6-hydroxymethyldihydropteridine diphosphokinase